MNRIRDFFAAHPKMTTALHVTLAVTPSIPFALVLIGFLTGFVLQIDFYAWVSLMAVGMLAFIWITGIFWTLSLLLYRFTHAVRESWPDWLRMTLIRFNIFGGFLTVVQVILIVIWLVKR